jgi:hypothetical protein
MARNELFCGSGETNEFVSGATPDTSAPDHGLKQSAYYCRFAWKLSNSGATDRTGLQDYKIKNR